MLCAKCTGCGLGCRGTEKVVKAKKVKKAVKPVKSPAATPASK